MAQPASLLRGAARLAVLLTVTALSACAFNDDDLTGALGHRPAAVQHPNPQFDMWSQGQTMEQTGEALIMEGRDMIAEGQARIAQGERMAAEGKRIQEEARAGHVSRDGRQARKAN